MLHRIFISFVFVFFVTIAAPGCGPLPRDAQYAETIFKSNQVLFDAVIRKIYAENPNFIAPHAGADELNVFDFDHTLSNTETMIPIKDVSGKVIARRDSKCFHVGKGEAADFTVFTRDKLMAGAGISLALNRARAHNRNKRSLLFVVTARSQAHTFQSARVYLSRKGVRVNAVIPVHSAVLMNELWNKLKLPAGLKKLPRGMKKPLLIGALVEFAREKNANVKTVRYYEDTDKYIGAYANFMARVYPNIAAEVYDYIRAGKPNQRVYREEMAARVRGGKVYAADGNEMVLPEHYASTDCPVK